mmetsp:Transcript_35549/g.77835  ORF Transcript_35549/g.77835 Transcript_35549/m.77835 type:complete len:228 (-) Transcript_35549:193-876(-)
MVSAMASNTGCPEGASWRCHSRPAAHAQARPLAPLRSRQHRGPGAHSHGSAPTRMCLSHHRIQGLAVVVLHWDLLVWGPFRGHLAMLASRRLRRRRLLFQRCGLRSWTWFLAHALRAILPGLGCRCRQTQAVHGGSARYLRVSSTVCPMISSGGSWSCSQKNSSTRFSGTIASRTTHEKKHQRRAAAWQVGYLAHRSHRGSRRSRWQSRSRTRPWCSPCVMQRRMPS